MIGSGLYFEPLRTMFYDPGFRATRSRIITEITMGRRLYNRGRVKRNDYHIGPANQFEQIISIVY